MWSSPLFRKLFLNVASLLCAFAIVILISVSLWQQQLFDHEVLWGVVILTTVAWGVASYALIGRAVRPLVELSQNVQRLASEEAERLAPIESSDEIETIATSIIRIGNQHEDQVSRLQQQTRQIASVLENLDEGIIAVSSTETILLANDASRQLLNLGNGDVTGRPLLEVARSHALKEAIQQASKTGKSYQAEFETTDEQKRALSLRAICLPGDPSPGVVLALHDISELRRLENLRQELVANVSHELKTPLSSIKGYAETLRLGAINDPDNNIAFVTRIEEQADRLHQLILDMIQIARVESGQETFEITSVSVDEVVDACISHFAREASQKQIRVNLVPPDEMVFVQADEDGLRTILDNLITNAIKYTPPNGDVTLRWAVRNQSVVIEVEDTGIGIAPEHQARVFERFFRVDRARSRELGGTGLGLSIVKHHAQSFGGTVGLSSTPGEGSTFEVVLRTAEEPQDTAVSRSGKSAN